MMVSWHRWCLKVWDYRVWDWCSCYRSSSATVVGRMKVNLCNNWVCCSHSLDEDEDSVDVLPNQSGPQLIVGFLKTSMLLCIFLFGKVWKTLITHSTSISQTPTKKTAAQKSPRMSVSLSRKRKAEEPADDEPDTKTNRSEDEEDTAEPMEERQQEASPKTTEQKISEDVGPSGDTGS